MLSWCLQKEEWLLVQSDCPLVNAWVGALEAVTLDWDKG